MKQVAVLYKCGACGKEYELSSGVEVVNKFAWVKWVKQMTRQCIGCRKGVDQGTVTHLKSDPSVFS